MKKKLLCFLLAVTCVLPFALTGCGGGDDTTDTGTKPMTLNIYGITGESTTEEAILKVQEKMNEYTEGKFNTHIVLHLYPEAEYYSVLDAKFAEIKKIKAEEEAEARRKKAEQNALKQNGQTQKADGTTAETAADTYEDHGVTKTVYPDEKTTQLDIFMVQGAANLNKYKDAGYVSALSDSLANTSKILTRYISASLLATATLDGTGNSAGMVDKGTVYGIPNNYVSGEYTYLLINRELAAKYYYSAADVGTLPTLANYLDDVSKNDKDYITLYNAPTLAVAYLTDTPSLIGGVVSNATNGFSRIIPKDMLSIPGFQNYWQNVYNFRKAGYITDGDYYAVPVDGEGNPKKVAAAFIKGNAALPADYEKDYFVINYANPMMPAGERPGTMFCVGTYTSNVDRCMEIITALQTVPSFRNTFQYGVENVNYTYDEYTGMITYMNDTYSMDPADTGNLFILTPNTGMSETVLKLAENDWALGKQQLRDTVTSPYAMFDFRVVTEKNYKTTSPTYLKNYAAALAAAKEEQGKGFDESKFVYDEPYSGTYTDVILSELVKLSEEYMKKIEAFEEYTDESGDTVTIKDYIKQLRKEFEANEYYQLFTDAKNEDSPYSQYNAWYTKAGPQSSM